MTGTGKALGVLLGGAVAVTSASAQPQTVFPSRAMTAPIGKSAAMLPNTAGAVRVNIASVVAAEYRDAVVGVIKSPTLSTRATASDVICTVSMYEWLFDHPDRVSLAWRRLKVAAVPIHDLGNGQFAWTDEHGSKVTWRVVGTFKGGLVWYATGKVKPGPVTPGVPVKAVAVLTRTQKATKDGVAAFSTSVQVYVHSDSRAAALAMRILGPAGAKVAEQGAEQFLDFFNGIAHYVQRHPSKAPSLLAAEK